MEEEEPVVLVEDDLLDLLWEVFEEVKEDESEAGCFEDEELGRPSFLDDDEDEDREDDVCE